MKKPDFSKLTTKRRVVSVTVEFIVETDEDDLEATVNRLLELKARPELGCLAVPAKMKAAVLWDKTWHPDRLRTGRRA